jgi:hypothetical protein
MIELETTLGVVTMTPLFSLSQLIEGWPAIRNGLAALGNIKGASVWAAAALVLCGLAVNFLWPGTRSLR